MAREIKFRVWDTVSKLWVAGWKMTQSGTSSEEKGYVWMQFTGLLDKNGKEIYEGDVLGYSNAEYGLSGYGGKWLMKWGSETDDDYGNCTIGYRTPSRKDEVIGNIYENPNLITTL